ncbi:hypothetical protein H257_14884 [Aphanomyces astaci]|uniref:Uncharacterized protein n=1 Tax=Aphanomyces astaci TaxID=112090 RepID=W4FRD5_APHAT|nr:hypothetical protein H257_14884 [Aphanomyces astaci]ETV69521.1 hypothetical protein H257_14884 [Aphanomyces astaci]|eukprot:XP_009841094.1 hypothetical protein H257_14884 [Aphanomyces astaci]
MAAKCPNAFVPSTDATSKPIPIRIKSACATASVATVSGQGARFIHGRAGSADDDDDLITTGDCVQNDLTNDRHHRYSSLMFAAAEKPSFMRYAIGNGVQVELQYFNLAAPDNGTLIILLSIFIAFGYVLAASASDAMVVKYTQREPWPSGFEFSSYSP